MMKTCKECGKTKPLEEYPGGKPKPRCKPCWAAHMRAYQKANPGPERERKKAYFRENREYFAAKKKEFADSRQRFLQAIKATAGCIDCGFRDDPARLHFDHRPGTVKLFELGPSKHKAIPVLLAEIEKCDVRCPSCHRKRHIKEQGFQLKGVS